MKKILPLLLTVIFLQCIVNAQGPRILWWFDTDDSSFGQSALDDIDGDQKYEIVFGCYRNDSMIYALNAEDGSLLWKYNASPGFAEGCNDVAMLIYDIDDDGQNEVIAPSSCNPTTFCFNGSDGSIKWSTPTDGSDSPPTIADIDNDGDLEIMHGEFGGDVFCMNAQTGVEEWNISVDANSWVQTAPTVLDVNDDGALDFVVATWGFNENSTLYAYDGATQTLIWSEDLDDVVYHGTAVADIDNDGKPELVIGDYSGKLWSFNAEDGSIVWTHSEDYYFGAPVTIGDINGDGDCEIIAISWFKMLAFNGNGTVLWEFDIPGLANCFRGVALADITNDSIPEVIFGSSKGSVYALTGSNGNELWSIDLQTHYGDTLEFDHAPVIGDFNGDDTLDLFIHGGHTNYPDFETNYGRGYALSLGVGSGPDWKMFQNNYHRTSSLCSDGGLTNINVEKVLTELKVFPNPSNGVFALSLTSQHVQDVTISIFNPLGREVYRENTKLSKGTFTKQIDLSNHPYGIYFINLQAAQGKVTRIVVFE